jgi:hypothetical protein
MVMVVVACVVVDTAAGEAASDQLSGCCATALPASAISTDTAMEKRIAG